MLLVHTAFGEYVHPCVVRAGEEGNGGVDGGLEGTAERGFVQTVGWQDLSEGEVR